MMSESESLSFSEWGERQAESFLQKKGFRILCRNYRAANSEIDLIVKKGNETRFVEVKTRQGSDFDNALEAVHWHKQRHILKAAAHYLSQLPDPDIPVSLDVVAVCVEGTNVLIKHIENAFEVD